MIFQMKICNRCNAPTLIYWRLLQARILNWTICTPDIGNVCANRCSNRDCRPPSWHASYPSYFAFMWVTIIWYLICFLAKFLLHKVNSGNEMPSTNELLILHCCCCGREFLVAQSTSRESRTPLCTIFKSNTHILNHQLNGGDGVWANALMCLHTKNRTRRRTKWRGFYAVNFGMFTPYDVGEYHDFFCDLDGHRLVRFIIIIIVIIICDCAHRPRGCRQSAGIKRISFFKIYYLTGYNKQSRSN